MKKVYAKIEFINCALDYDYTICNWVDVPDYIAYVEHEAAGLDEKGYNSWKEKGLLPEAKVSIIMMSDSDFDKWFKENVEDND